MNKFFRNTRIMLNVFPGLIFFFSVIFWIAPEAFASDCSVLLSEDVKVSERIFGLKGLSNVGRVSKCIFRGAQPTAEGYITLKETGIRTVINLRYNHSEKKAVEEAGMKSIEIPFSVFKKMEKGKVKEIIDIMSDPANQPVFVHCAQGKDRTGAVVAIYRMEVDGWSLAMAESEMQEFGFNDMWSGLKKFVRDYAKSIGK